MSWKYSGLASNTFVWGASCPTLHFFDKYLFTWILFQFPHLNRHVSNNCSTLDFERGIRYLENQGLSVFFRNSSIKSTFPINSFVCPLLISSKASRPLTKFPRWTQGHCAGPKQECGGWKFLPQEALQWEFLSPKAYHTS